jgi:hypothetical protein
MVTRIAVVFLFALFLAQVPGHSVSTVALAQLDDSDPVVLRLSTAQYEVSLLKSNGAVVGFQDKMAGTNLPVVSRGNCLWGMSFFDDGYVGGCSFDRSGTNRFTYSWSQATGRLTLAYQNGIPAAANQANAEVTLTPGGDDYLDMGLTIWNTSQKTALAVHFPSDLLVARNALTEAYLPFGLPGVRIKPSFFAQHKSVGGSYPSFSPFADFQYAGMGATSLAYYSVNPAPNPIAPVYLGYQDDEPAHPGMTFLTHSYRVNIGSGVWTSPKVRFRIGKTIQDVMQAYRIDNLIEQYPSIHQKLGQQKFDQISHSVLIKAEMRDNLDSWAARFSHISPPALLHLVGFHTGGFDRNYPDFLPPDPAIGTMAGLRALVEHEKVRGNLVMPYINPTWWDDTAPTTLNELPPAGLTIRDIAARNRDGTAVYETYNINTGYVVSPAHPFVANRLDRLMRQWQLDVPVDCVFEDQIGARGWREDFNPTSVTPIAYSDSWLAHTQTYAQRCLMTEMGWDRLAATEVGFTGTLLVPFASPDSQLGAGNWEAYPLANWLFEGKVLFYQHDLEPFTVTGSSNMLIFNMAFGMMLSYQPNWWTITTVQDPKLDAVTILQRNLVYRMAGASLLNFEHLAPHVTRSNFSMLAVTANWDAVNGYDTPQGRIAPRGFLARSPDGNVIGGLFNGTFNGKTLAGEHLILVQKSADQVDVWMPLGDNTPLTVPAPAQWAVGGKEKLLNCAYKSGGALIGCQEVYPSRSQVTFLYAQNYLGQKVYQYRMQIMRHWISLPLTSR